MKNTCEDEGDLDELNRYLVRRINLHFEAMRRMNLQEAISYVHGIIEQNEVVIGVFVDISAPEGIEVRVIKGTSEMQAVADWAQLEGLRIDAVPCHSFEQAVVAALFTSDRRRTSH